MQVLSQSAFLQALGYAIAGSLWQAALLWLLVAGVHSLFKIPSQVKYKIALAAQFGAFIWFLVSLQFYYTKCAEAIAMLRYSGVSSANAFIFQPGTHSFSSTLLNGISKGEKLLPFLSVAYLCLLFVLAVRWVKGYRQTVLIKTQGLQKIDIQWRLFVKRISEMLNIKHPVKIYVSELVKSPLTVGFLKPLILVPLASINNLTAYQLEAVILHELAHIKRADYIINIIQSIIEISLFFNPFIQLLGKTVKRERENSCDDWVLQFQYDPSTYAEALLRIAYMQQTPAFAMNAGGKENDLLWRVKRMLNQQEKTFQYRNRLLALLLITGLLSSVAWFNPGIKTTTAKPTASARSQTVVIEPLAVRVDNPLFNPLSFMNKPFKEEVNKAAEDAGIGLEQATRTLANHALVKLAPAVEQVQTLDVDLLPAVASKTTDAVKEAFADADTKQLFANLFTENKDSAATLKLVNFATAQLKNVAWDKVSNGIKAAQKEVAKELAGKKVWAEVGGAKLQDVINNSMKLAAQSVSQWQVKSGDFVSDDNNTTPAAQKKPAAVPNAAQRPQAIRVQGFMKYNEAKKRSDSLRKEYTLLQKKRKHTDLGDLSGDVALQYSNDWSNKVYNSYSVPQAYTVTPATFNESNLYNTAAVNATGFGSSTSGKSTLIAVKEEKGDENSHKKRLTIVTMDEKGEKHSVQVVVEVYQ